MWRWISCQRITTALIVVHASFWTGCSVAPSDAACNTSFHDEVEQADDQQTIDALQISLFQHSFKHGSSLNSPGASRILHRESASGEAFAQAAVLRTSHTVDAYQEEHIQSTQSEDSILRPHAGSGPDKVHFGIYGKSCFNIDLKEETFQVDSVLLVQWSDTRAIKLVPPGLTSISMSKEQFQGKLWLPDVEITNHIPGNSGYDVISTTVTVNSSGFVTKVERTKSTINNRYRLERFPWDSQVLAINIASTTFMVEDVKLVPITDLSVSGVRDDLVEGKGFDLVSHEISEFEETDGPLRKSRGTLMISIQRDPSGYIYSIILPMALLLGMSWAVFWLPLLPQFAMPRLSMSIIAFLSSATLSLRLANMLPPLAPLTWNDAYSITCQTLMCFAIVLNIFAEVVNRQRGELADKMHIECRVFWPVVASMAVMVCLLGRKMEPATLLAIGESGIAAVFIAYATWSCLRFFQNPADADDEPHDSQPRSSSSMRALHQHSKQWG